MKIFYLFVIKMQEQFENKLFILCRSVDINQCIKELKIKLTKKSQIEEYDLIYNEFVKTCPLKDYTIHSVIPGLDRIVTLIVLCLYYRHLLFPNIYQEVQLNEEKLYWLLSLFDKEYSSFSFLFVVMQLSELYNNEVFNEEIYNSKKDILSEEAKQLAVYGSPYFDVNFIDVTDEMQFPTERYYFYYILLHKAGDSSFQSIVNFLVEDENITKIPLAFKFYITEGEGAHAGDYKDPQSFLSHEVEHMGCILQIIPFYDYSSIKKLLNLYTVGSIKYRIIIIYLYVYLFEDHKGRDTNDISYDLENRIKNIIVKIDHRDSHYYFKYLMESTDINDSNLIIDYIECKEKLQEMLIEIKKLDYGEEWTIIHDEMLKISEDFWDKFCNSQLNFL